jgi:PAS domain S-box-containing protein
VEDYRVGGSWIRHGPQVESITGYAAEQFSVPNFWKTILHPADRDRVLAEDERCERTLEPWRNTFRVTGRDGRTVFVRDEAMLVYDDAGEPHCWQGVWLNVTERTMAQLEANRRRAALDELHAAFLTAVSHELRTPLAAILGTSLTLERASSRLSQEATAELLRALSASARRLDRLLTNLIDLERLGWGTVPLDRRPFDIATLLERVAARWRHDGPWPQVCAASATVWLDPDKVDASSKNYLPTRPDIPRRAPRSGSAPGGRAPASAWPSRTPARACRASCAPRCSSASATPTPLAPTRPALALDCPWCFAWRSCTAGLPGSRTAPGTAHPSR